MRSSAHFKGHPIHPMLIPFPFAYLFGSALVGVWARATDRPHWSRTAEHLNRLGLGSALAAAVPGLIDYIFAVPPKSSGRQRATNHMVANLSAVGLFAAARLGRNETGRPSRAALAAEVCGAGLLAAGGWLGGTLVYRNQIGVDHRYAGAGKWRLAIAPPGREPIEVGSADELEVGQMKLVRVGQARVVIGRTERGYVAFDDRCPHRGGSLADGALACDIVQCPWHGSQFDVHTGAVSHGPAEEGIRTYPITLRDGRLWLSAASEGAGDTLKLEAAPRPSTEDGSTPPAEALGGAFDLPRALSEARTRAGLSQAQLARRMKTTPAYVARLEGGTARPSAEALERFAEATGTRLRIMFEPEVG